MVPETIDLQAKFAAFDGQWQPKIIAELNDYHLKLAKIKGDFIWHSHPETDELFLVVEGEMTIQFRDGATPLTRGQLCVVPRGIEHRPTAEHECHILLIEPAGTTNTGEAGGERTAPGDAWI
jgi:mannose-6-phosphate isomerase-like protein (cupin superfamily)